MKVFDIINEEETNNVYNPAGDHRNQRNLDDTRKPKLTLKHLNKLRKMRELKKVDMKDRREGWETMYGAPSEDASPAGF